MSKHTAVNLITRPVANTFKAMTRDGLEHRIRVVFSNEYKPWRNQTKLIFFPLVRTITCITSVVFSESRVLITQLILSV